MEEVPFGRYRLRDLLGKGGMGRVYRAYDTATDRIVALKVLPDELAGDANFQERFRREAHAAAALTEPHVVPIHSFGEIDGRLYVDMRLIEGVNLEAVLREGRGLDPERAVSITDQVASALSAAHKVGLVHRDVKPSNILVTERDFVYLIDFGIARGTTEQGMTQAGQMVGTWAYMAPERFDTGKVDPRSDVYALGCVLYECLTCRRPYPGDTLEQQMTGHLTIPPPRPSERFNVSPEFDAVVTRGMAKDPAQRYQTTLELANAARDALTMAQTPRMADPTNRMPRPLMPQPPGPMTPPPHAQQHARPHPSGPIPSGQWPPNQRANQNPNPNQQAWPPIAPPPGGPTTPPPGGPSTPPPGGHHLSGPVPVPGGPSTPWPPTSRPEESTPWWRGKAAVIGAVVVLVLGITTTAVVATSGGDDPDNRTQPPTTETASTTAPTTSVMPLNTDALLLSPDAVNDAMGASGMTIAEDHQHPPAVAGDVVPPDCASVRSSAKSFNDSGYQDFHGQLIQQPGEFTDSVNQNIAKIASSARAQQYLDGLKKQWAACNGQVFTENPSNAKWLMQGYADTGTVISAVTVGQESVAGQQCEDARGIKKNFIAAVTACRRPGVPPNGVAVEIVNKILSAVT